MAERVRRNRLVYGGMLFLTTIWGGIGLLGLGADAQEGPYCEAVQQAYLNAPNQTFADALAAQLQERGCTVPVTSTTAPSTTSTSSTSTTSTSTTSTSTTSTSTTSTSTTTIPTTTTVVTPPAGICALIAQQYVSNPAVAPSLQALLVSYGCTVPSTSSTSSTSSTTILVP